MVAPTFICVGMPKCGTSTVHDVLRCQDEIFVPPVKEVQFLALDTIQYKGSLWEILLKNHWAARQDRLAILRIAKRTLLRGGSLNDLLWSMKYVCGPRTFKWYFSLFPEGRIAGDISPAYCLLPVETIRGIAEIMPKTKIIIMLRSPLQQIWSHCRMSVVRINKNSSAHAFKDHIEQLTLMRRTYRSLVEDWSVGFAGRLFIGYLEEMAANPAHFFVTLLQFLGAERDEVSLARDPLIMTTKSHVGVPYDVPEAVRATLADHAVMRLEGFEVIAPTWAAKWRAEVEDFRHVRRHLFRDGHRS